MGLPQPHTPKPAAPRLLAWYDRQRRALPWRVPAGERAEPYRVWLSEIMLQQTTIEAVKPYYAKFLRLWPDVFALAAAEDQSVMSAWAGLGYYARARNLLACARQIVRGYDGRFPGDEKALRALPGIGDYTAAAIRAIAFEEPALVIDGNVERVMTRYRALETPLPKAKPKIRSALAAIAPATRPGDFAQAMMDLGATICTPRNPACALCPWNEDCIGRLTGAPTRFPVRLPKAARPVRHGAAFVVWNPHRQLLLRTRPPKGLLASMSEVPGSAWSADLDETGVGMAAPFALTWHKSAAPVIHVFTHFELRLQVFAAWLDYPAPLPEGCRWVGDNALADEALPSLMLKVIAAARAVQAGPKNTEIEEQTPEEQTS